MHVSLQKKDVNAWWTIPLKFFKMSTYKPKYIYLVLGKTKIARNEKIKMNYYILGFSYSQNMVNFEVFGWNILSSINLFFWRVMCLRHSFWKRQGNECLVLTSMDTFASMEFCLGFPIRWLIPKSRLWYNGIWSWFFTLNHNLWMAFEK